ncbi:response regulator [Geobacter sp. SVR]|uniref:response regulator n=1 Tax=Geobacter sp. SVR TaxID=2495594 RepID=UPI00156623AF|nr:response regulator [Geobacter sp. SVR]
MTLLHVEDDPLLARLVKASFAGFGFYGTMLTAGGVDEALDLLDARARNREPVDLILVDMQLPDGTGLDVIREVKGDPSWSMVPVIVLSNESAEGMVNGAYALGANCYMPKIPKPDSSLSTVQALYKCWLEAPHLPQQRRRDRFRDALHRAVHLRARTSDFYLGLAQVFAADQDEMRFWLDSSLNEGNMSNLMAFFRNTLGEGEVSAAIVERLVAMQIRVRKALTAARVRLRRNPAPSPGEACLWALDVVDALDEQTGAEVLGCLFPKGPSAIIAIKGRAASQLRNLAQHVMKTVENGELHQRAQALLGWGERLEAELKTAAASSA